MKINEKKLIADIASKCLKNNFSFNLVASKFVEAGKGIKCSGYFDEKELIVASLKKDWIDVLIHESCHLDQFVENCKYWREGEDGIIMMDAWLLKKKSYSQSRLEKAIKSTILLELDCEKRTVRKMKKYGLKINQSLYIQRANSYLLSYWASYRDRKWYPFPYEKKSIFEKMPKTFMKPEEYLTKDHQWLSLYK
jgi:hypothetical protein